MSVETTTYGNGFNSARRRFFAVVAVLAAVMLSASGLRAQQKEIIVSAAASLKDAFTEIGAIYEKKTGVKPNFNFAASGVLQKQIETGAPVDVFASAAEAQMDALQKQGLLDDGTRADFAANSLVLIVPSNSKLGLKALADLADPKVERIAVGNPKTVPAGQYAQEALTSLKLWDGIQPRVVFAENVRQVLDYVSRGEVDAGLVYGSDTVVAKGKVRIAAEAPQGSHAAITYPIVVVKDAPEPAAAKKFIGLVQSKEGQAILKKYGFAAVK